MPTRVETGTNNSSTMKHGCSVALEEYFASTPTIAEALAFSSVTKVTSCQATSRPVEIKESLDRWQSAWDRMQQHRKQEVSYPLRR
ncbi:hypothetical protein F5Y13DRAFT_160333 [Hypoxylon sp. FL1857]|nr:hypothetical protein F5Y13DRAFT_160333 [Hypoxylon sp. FL1857]